MKYKVTCSIDIRADSPKEAREIVSKIVREGLEKRDLKLQRFSEELKKPIELINICSF